MVAGKRGKAGEDGVEVVLETFGQLDGCFIMRTSVTRANIETKLFVNEILELLMR